LFYDRLKLQLK